MTDESDDETVAEAASTPPKGAAAQRAERLKTALRDNLRRRKAQVRSRAASDPEPGASAGSRDRTED